MHWQWKVTIALFAAAIAIVCVTLYVTRRGDDPKSVIRLASITTQANPDPLKVATFDELLALSPEQRAKVDMARANLLVAKASPKTGDLDIEKELRTLDQWTAHVKSETERNMHRFRDNRRSMKTPRGTTAS